ncbi:MAG: hypothetical protein K8T90_17515 [Planctomycetes bacterium]|nr:hypothetical protein [Planctomycetota bacterium]
MRRPARRFVLAASAGVVVFAALVTSSRAADGPDDRKEPSVGYVYPAGGRKATVVQVLAAGQNLRGVTAASVSGVGVSAKVLRFMRPLSPQQLAELRRQLAAAADPRARDRVARRDAKTPEAEVIELPDHPMLKDFDKKSPKELRDVAARFIGSAARRQVNVQIAETVEIEVTIDRDAAPGDREIRLVTPSGLTNPLRFQVGALPEAMDDEVPNPATRDLALIDLPVVLNGQILPGDADRFRFRAKRGQRLVFDASARRLVPFLADAVPGWFQATMSLYDGAGEEIAFADDYRFDPDPVLFVDVPADGEYVLEVRDALWRGREDFVYRVTVSDEPFITGMFPLGGRAGSERTATVLGWNLGPSSSAANLPLDMSAEEGAGGGVRWAVTKRGGVASNALPYAVDDLPECDESEPNDSAATAQTITIPGNVNGRIGKPGDVDWFTFLGLGGDEIVVDVEGRRLQSPIDSLVTLTDATGKVLGWNDDFDDGSGGIGTHAADSFLRVKLPAYGQYRLKIADAQAHGGPEFGYRVRIGLPAPDFGVFATPSGVRVPAGHSVPFTARLVRTDGFLGEVEVRLKDAPAGWMLSGGRIPAGHTSVRMTIAAPPDAVDAVVPLQLEAVALIGGTEVHRAVVAADERMQAFIYKHVVPAQEFAVATVAARRNQPPVVIAGTGAVRIPAGGAATVRIELPGRELPRGFDVRLALDEGPAGLRIEGVRTEPSAIVFTVRADAAAATVGTTDNLIVEAYLDLVGLAAFGAPEAPTTPGKGDAKKPGAKSKAPDGKGAAKGAGKGDGPGGLRRLALGYLPAIPFEIVAK